MLIDDSYCPRQIEAGVRSFEENPIVMKGVKAPLAAQVENNSTISYQWPQSILHHFWGLTAASRPFRISFGNLPFVSLKASTAALEWVWPADRPIRLPRTAGAKGLWNCAALLKISRCSMVSHDLYYTVMLKQSPFSLSIVNN